MWLQMWHPDFKPEEDSPMAPIWVLLPKLPFHCHAWNYVRQILEPIGTPLIMDAATSSRTRPSMAKVRVEVDLTKPQIDKIWVGLEDESHPLKGFYQKIEYESVPKFCTHCRKIGHSLVQCRFAKKKNDENKDEENREIVDQAETSKNRDNKGKGNFEVEIENRQIEEIVVETQAAKTKGGKHREKRKQRRRRNALKVVRNKGKGNHKNEDKNQREEKEKVEKDQEKGNSNEQDSNQFISKEQQLTDEVEGQKKHTNVEKSGKFKGTGTPEEQQDNTKENQTPKTVVVITTSEKEENSTHEITVPINPPVKIQNAFQSIADDTRQPIEEEEQEQSSENTLSEIMVPGTNQKKKIHEKHVGTDANEELPEKSETGSSYDKKEEADNCEFNKDMKSEQENVDSLSDEEVADSLINAFAPEPNMECEVQNQIKEAVDKGNLSPRGTEIPGKKKQKQKPSTSTPAMVTRGKGRG
ncbi:uncharacterized protein LOC132601893 [Lycium barbarum]|uniref:uncharacterized protein LOC132601893 n=1 Tax=Lycium barbarum TaxID=112863 RepID=UPI00293E60AA|nr:uncharacterized protein LOC132601893 [Lycium barbarum]